MLEVAPDRPALSLAGQAEVQLQQEPEQLLPDLLQALLPDSIPILMSVMLPLMHIMTAIG